MSAMDTDDVSVVLPPSTVSGLSLSLHPLPILSISEHWTRLKLLKNTNNPFVIGALLGTQTGREVEIVNTFELATVEGNDDLIDHEFLKSRRDQYKQVFPSLEIIGWYTVVPQPTPKHVALHEQFTDYCSTPILLILQQSQTSATSTGSQRLPYKAYEPTIEIKERTSRTMFIEVPFNVETGEAERIAVDWTARGGGGVTSLESHLQTQRAAVKMLHDRILVLVKYVTDIISGQTKKDYDTLRSLSALVASLPATENKGFRAEYDKEYEDVQLTAFLSTLTRTTNTLNDLVDKHLVLTASSREERIPSSGRRRLGRQGGMPDWDRMR